MLCYSLLFFFFFNDTATTEIYTLSLHDALPILLRQVRTWRASIGWYAIAVFGPAVLFLLDEAVHLVGTGPLAQTRSEEHTSELQSQSNLVCRLLLEKKKNTE